MQIIDTPEGIQAFHMLAQYHALKLEVAGIMVNPAQRRRSLAKFIRQQYNLTGRTKQNTLDNFHAYLVARGVIKMEGE